MNKVCFTWSLLTSPPRQQQSSRALEVTRCVVVQSKKKKVFVCVQEEGQVQKRKEFSIQFIPTTDFIPLFALVLGVFLFRI